MTVQAHRLSSQYVHTYWSNALPPKLTVASGDIVTFDTLDSGYGQVARDITTVAQPGIDPELIALIEAEAYPERSTEDRDPSLTRGHPLTGPVAVTGAAPGDTLVVDIVGVETAAWGFTKCRAAGSGLLGEILETETYHHIWDLRNGTAVLRPGIQVPVAPFCGIMGVAPAEPGQHSTIPPGRHGGNMDLRHLTAGATLHLPVLTAGALLSVGDAHAAQGDGEVCGTAVETAARVTVRIDLLPGVAPSTPEVRTSGQPLSIPGDYHVTVGSEPDLLDAARTALRGTIGYLTAEHGLSPAEAYVLCSACVDLKITQLVDLPNVTVSAYLPLAIFQ